jgi:hypothetical protein
MNKMQEYGVLFDLVNSDTLVFFFRTYLLILFYFIS